MKKTLLSLAAVAVTFVANAAPTVIKTNPNQSNPLPANTVIANNEFFTATTTFDAKGGQTGKAYVFGDVNLAGTGWFQLRSDAAPNAASPFGVQKADCTSIKVEVKKPVTLYCYLRTGNNKQTAVNVFNSSFETMPYANGETGKNCGADGEKNNMWEFSWTLSAGTYCMTEIGGTGNVAGLGYEEAEDPGTSEDPAEGETFAMKGNGAATYGQSFDEIVTPLEFDKVNKTVTLSDFLGSKANIVIKFEQADPNKDPDMTGTVFNSVAVSGLGEGNANTGCAIENFTGSVIIKKDGANFGKLENVTFWPGFNSQLVVDTKSINGTNQKVYNLTLMIGGDFYKWDAATSAWGEKEKYPEFFKLEKDIPFVSDDQSGIDSIVTDSADENAPVEYYNLQGIRLSEPAAGQIVIRRQGSKVSKIVVR